MLQSCTAYILPVPPTPARLPRPDDSSPRVPPPVFFQKRRLDDLLEEGSTSELSSKKRKSASNRIRVKSGSAVVDPMVRRAREIMKTILRGSQEAASGHRRSSSQSTSSRRLQPINDKDIFKTPPLPKSHGQDEPKEALPDIAKELE